MIDARRILEDLARQASDLAKDPNIQARMDDAKGAAAKVRERLETDPKARTIAAGAGGLLLLGMLGSKGGRKFVGNVARTGIVAGLGASPTRPGGTGRARRGGRAASQGP